MWHRERLIAALAERTEVDWLFFWGHTPAELGEVDRSCLSQWFGVSFELDGETFASAEHFMMAAKARACGDESTRAAIIRSIDPAEAKALGRSVASFDPARWEPIRFDVVVRGNLAKFGAHPALRDFLLSTGERILVEAAPNDTIWGIGLAATSPHARDPARWPGLNLLGFALMEVRAALRAAGTAA